METLIRSLFALIQAGELSSLIDLMNANPSLAFSTDPNGISPVLYALYCRRLDMARTLAAMRTTAASVYESAAFGDLKPIRAALERSPDLPKAFGPDGFSLLHLAAFFGHPEVLTLLLEKGADPNSVSRNDAHLHVINSAAAQSDHGKSARTVDLLLKAGADPNAAHSAAGHGNLEVLRLLKAAQAALDRKADDGKTPLQVAKDLNQAAAIAFLQA